MKLTDIDRESLESLAREGLVSKSIFHEIKNWLAILNKASSAALLSEDIEEIKQQLLRIYQASQKIHRTEQNIRMVFDNRLQGLETFRLSVFLDEVLRNSIPKDIRPSTSMTATIDPTINVYGNRSLIEEVFRNLIENAIHANVGNPDPWVRISAEMQSGRAQIRITDSGTISPEILPSIFNPLFTTKGSQGSGIGLPLSRMITELHQGSLTCNLENGHTCFELMLPTTAL
jgi:two-component system, NtrC family, sensor kinase